MLFINVLKILAAAMENVDGEASGPSTSAEPESSTDFYNTGRVGRRNALPDILSSHATVSTADLPEQLSALTTSDKSVASTSSSNVGMDIQPTTSTTQISTTSSS
ncbi:cAMP-dependent protein kinase inhibitor beta-like isoform X2 [Contarinia nasturtii]|uniref:cAMP-dependent protein kinase inhibitor beta-like isoform X2 n=1 Tax=Contarinia nasturtii TaxID=265458 RepID=UPI0012D4A186|nr:cAMP-dependent protein kinase inhibitor beta-like isoform X2 [Contarinia nasturtii]